MAQPVDDALVGSDKSADGCQRFAERSHDEVHFVGQPEVVAHAAALTSEHAEAVRLVHHDGGVVFVLQADYFGQVGQVAFHRENAVDDDELDGLGSTLLQLALQIGHVVVLVFQTGGERKATAVHDGCVVAVVADDVVFATRQAGHHAGVDAETCGEAQGLVFAHELGQLTFELHVQIERPVEKA